MVGSVKKLSEKEYQADIMYQMTMSIARKMLANGLITETEFAEFDTKMQAKYSPVFGTLFSDNQLTSPVFRGNIGY